MTLKYSSMDTIFIPSDKKELRSKFLQKVDEDDESFKKGVEVAGGRTGKFIEKPDIIDKYCRRELSENNPELGELTPIQFGKIYDPIRRNDKKEELHPESCEETDDVQNLDELRRKVQVYICDSRLCCKNYQRTEKY